MQIVTQDVVAGALYFQHVRMWSESAIANYSRLAGVELDYRGSDGESS